MPDCGSQVILCGLPIRFDTYRGCSHLCKYCFAQRKVELRNIKTNETVASLRAFIEGKRTQGTNWCDWSIPIHWGGLSDPFQPIEIKYKNSLECLKIFAETKYPFIVSTKGRLIVEPEYLNLIEKCNCVVQISAICNKYDKIETGAPPFDERLKMISILSKKVRRVIVRIQPYLTEAEHDVLENLPKFREAGAYGVIVEGMKFAKKKDGLVKVGGDFAYSKELLERHFKKIKEKAHDVGLKFYCGENRLRNLGDSMVCCGIDGLEGFKPNLYNLCNLINGDKTYPTERMQEKGTGKCFGALNQSAAGHRNIKDKSFNECMLEYYRDRKKYIHELFGK